MTVAYNWDLVCFISQITVYVWQISVTYSVMDNGYFVAHGTFFVLKKLVFVDPTKYLLSNWMKTNKSSSNEFKIVDNKNSIIIRFFHDPKRF